MQLVIDPIVKVAAENLLTANIDQETGQVTFACREDGQEIRVILTSEEARALGVALVGLSAISEFTGAAAVRGAYSAGQAARPITRIGRLT